ncbi:unnamed protein product [Phyllotreta striolata]|uniref:NADH dehydrogenase [ubiquinone] flavoprotein 3, mitochondrial n=1 Tax=Phyllotreta striolata TaxID=444603 RepID=A0A9N9TV57_PHYSR|nr:unnamed protein product [Phyllotreta striolata]
MWQRHLIKSPKRASILHTKFNFTTGKVSLKDEKGSSGEDGKSCGNNGDKWKKILAKVKGLSEAVLEVPCDPVGPGASKEGKYKNPEYYCYHKYSFVEALVELQKYRASSSECN